MAKREEKLKGTMKRFEKFLEKKDLEFREVEGVSIRKRRGRTKKKEETERRKGREDKKITYLGYIMQKNGRRNR